MKNNDKTYDYSKFKAFDNIPCGEGEILFPVVMDREMTVTLQEQGLDRRNMATLHFPRAKKGVPVAFIRIRKEDLPVTEYYLNIKAKLYLNGEDNWNLELLSLDEMMDAASDPDDAGFDPTGDGSAEEDALRNLQLLAISEKLAVIKPVYAEIFRLICQEYTKKEILSKIGWTGSRSRGYELIEHVRHLAAKLYQM